MTKPLLSICIPTRNRAAFLYRTLRSIADNPVFANGNDVEVIISDNASTDATPEIAKLFTDKYGGKVVYSRNDVDIADKNFEKSLRLARGVFRKLANDTLCFDEDGVRTVLTAVKENAEKRPVLFFADDNEKPDCFCHSLNDFVKQTSFLTTWIGAFGIWDDDLEKIADFSAHADRQLTQTEIVLQMVADKKEAIVVNRHFGQNQKIWDKAGYIVEKIFGQYYLDILNGYVDCGMLSKAVFRAEKKRVLQKHILDFYFSRNLKYERTGLFKNLKKHYAFCPYFYTSALAAWVRGGLVGLTNRIKIKRRGVEGNFRKQWKKRNKLSSVIPVKVEYPNSVCVEDGTSGDLFAENCNPAENTLIIGKNVKIGKDVRFVFNGGRKAIVIPDNTEIKDGTTVFSNEAFNDGNG